MKEIVIISGKGGTGKTSIVSAFASLVESKAICDADVDAADLHLILNPEVKERHDFHAGHKATIDPDKCTQCGLCREMCRWNAISRAYVVDEIECEGCGVCRYFCPEDAVLFPVNACGEWFLSDTRFGPLAHAKLGIAEENSGKLVTLIRKEGKELAEKEGLRYLLTDGPPGVGCPVIASIGGARAVLIVAEPTVSGKHDMERVSQLAAFFKVPAMLCVNKFDLNPDMGKGIEAFSRQKGVTPIGRVPFDTDFTRAMVQGKTIVEFNEKGKAAQAVEAIWKEMLVHLS